MTLTQCLDKTRKLINYYSISGEEIGARDPVALDYRHRALSAIDTAQKELAARRPLVRRLSLTQHALRPLASKPGLRLLSDELCLEARGARAFSLLCDGALSIRLEATVGGSLQSLYSASHTGSGQMETLAWEAADGLVSADTPVRLILTGEGAFIADAALYAAFPAHEDIPILGARRRHALPEGFHRLLACRPQGKLGQVMRTGFARIEDGKIGLPWDFEGVAALDHTAHPRDIGEDTDPDTQLEVPEDAAEAIPYYAAAMLLTQEDPKLCEFFLQLYTDRLRALEAVTGFGIRNELFTGGRR